MLVMNVPYQCSKFSRRKVPEGRRLLTIRHRQNNLEKGLIIKERELEEGTDENMVQDAEHSGGAILLVITIIVALISAALIIFSWLDVYHRLEHGGRSIDLCNVYAALAKSTAPQEDWFCARH